MRKEEAGKCEGRLEIRCRKQKEREREAEQSKCIFNMNGNRKDLLHANKKLNSDWSLRWSLSLLLPLTSDSFPRAIKIPLPLFYRIIKFLEIFSAIGPLQIEKSF